MNFFHFAGKELQQVDRVTALEVEPMSEKFLLLRRKAN